MSYLPLIVIGAPRSGTNMLRDSLTELPGVGTWPCDEINYIWRHGNVRYASDEFSPDMATSSIRHYIKKKFDAYAHKNELDILVEKTCANSLRVDFVDRVIPDAKYIFIVRDGLDVVGSAMLRWTAKLDIQYLLKKARYVPPTDLPYYASRYFYNRIYRVLSSEKKLAFWGPKLDNMEFLLKKYSLSQVCALQWQACVNSSKKDLSLLDPDRVIFVRYETFVQEPATETQRIAEWLGKPVSLVDCERMVAGVSAASIGKGRAQLSEEQLNEVFPLISKTLMQNGYDA